MKEVEKIISDLNKINDRIVKMYDVEVSKEEENGNDFDTKLTYLLSESQDLLSETVEVLERSIEDSMGLGVSQVIRSLYKLEKSTYMLSDKASEALFELNYLEVVEGSTRGEDENYDGKTLFLNDLDDGENGVEIQMYLEDDLLCVREDILETISDGISADGEIDDIIEELFIWILSTKFDIHLDDIFVVAMPDE